MLQYNVLYCNRQQEAKLYRNTKLYCDSGLGSWARGWACWAYWARRQALGERLGAQAERWALGAGRRQGAQAAGCRARRRTPGRGRARGAQAAVSAGAKRGR